AAAAFGRMAHGRAAFRTGGPGSAAPLGHADDLQRAGDRGARAPRPGLHAQAVHGGRPGAPPDLRRGEDRADTRRRALRQDARAGPGRPLGLVRVRGRHRSADRRGAGGPRRDARHRGVLGRGEHQRPQGAGRPRLRHQRLVPRPRHDRAGVPDHRRRGQPVARPRPHRGFPGRRRRPRDAVLARGRGACRPPRGGRHPGRRGPGGPGGHRPHHPPREGGARHVQAQRLQHRRAAGGPLEGRRDPL
ncbi:MAG: Acyl transferase, partial [uncultured Acetobacteraceae bacterium]